MTYISKPNFAYLRETTHTSITMCGACHTDRLMFLDKHMFPERHRHTDGVPQTGRINSASRHVRLGGVAAIITRHLAGSYGRGKAQLLGVKPVAAHHCGYPIERLLEDEGLSHTLIEIDGEAPECVVVIDRSGKVFFGSMVDSLYEEVSPELLISSLVGVKGALVLDANFSKQTLEAIAKAWPTDQPLFAAGTSAHKVERFARCLKRIDALVLSLDEAAVLYGGVHNVGRMALRISGNMKRDNAALLIHNGSNEAALAMGGNVVTYEPPRTRIVNPVGMGSVVAAELFASLMTGDTDPNRLLEGALDAGVKFASSAFGDGR